MHPYFVVCIIAFLAAQSYAASEKTAGEVLKRYSRLSLEERRRALEAGAKQEGVVAFYGTIGAGEAKILIESFHKRHPYVSVRYTRSGTSPLLSRILAEYRGGKRDVDVINLTGATAFVVMERGLVDPYFSSESSMIQSGLMHPKGLWVAVEQDLHVVGYNTRFVSPASLPRSYHDLLDKRWANSVSLDQTDEDWLQGLANEWGEAKAVEFVRSLMQLQPKLQRGRSLRAQLLAAGEFSIALNLYDYRINQLKAQGAPVDYLLLDPIMIIPTVLMLARHSPHPHAAALFIDWLISQEGQAVLESAEIGRPSVRKGMGRALNQLIGRRNVKILTPEMLGPKSDHYIKLYKEITRQ